MNRRQLIAFLGCSVSIGVFGAFNNFTMTLWLSGLTSSYLLLGLMGNTRSFEGTLVAPVVGAWSDRVWLGRLGRRRPFILTGGLTSALLLALTPAVAAWRAPAALAWLNAGHHGLVPAIASIFVFTLTFNAMGDVHDALLIDISTPAARNRLAALRVVVGMAAQVAILVLGFVLWHNAVPASAFVITAALVAAGTLVTGLGVHEAPPQARPARTAPAAAPRRPSMLRMVLTNRPAAVLYLVVFAYWTGINAVLPLISIYTRDILHASTGASQLLPAVLLLSTTAFALPVAKLGDRFGKRRVLTAGYALVMCAGLLALVITTETQGALVFLLAGLGNAAGQVLTLPLLADFVDRKEIGAATGILAASGSVAAPLASLAGGGLADLFGPRAIFALMAAMVAIAIGLLRFLPARSRPLDDSAPAEPLLEALVA